MNNKRVGELVKIIDWKGSLPDTRVLGTVITIEPSPHSPGGAIAEVMWQDGGISWILMDRLGGLDEAV